MLELVPEWKDQRVWDKDRQSILAYGEKLGFTPDELKNATDPRAVIALDKARRYDELMARKPQPSKVLRGPRVLGAGTQTPAPKAHEQAARRLAKSGRVDDAAQVFMGLLD